MIGKMRYDKPWQWVFRGTPIFGFFGHTATAFSLNGIKLNMVS